MPKRNIATETVAVAYVHPVDTVGADFHASLIKLLVTDAGGPRRMKLHLHLASGANITTSRNEIVRQFLNFTTPKIDWLWSVDADMRFDPDIVERLIRSADPVDRPIMGGLCFALDRGEGSTQEIVPTIYGFAADGEDGMPPSMVRFQNYEKDAVVPVAATGAACMLVHRRVLEDLGERWTEAAPWNWYQEAVFNGGPIGEDVTFCLRAAQAGYPLFVDTAAKTGHTKPFVMDEAMFDRQFNSHPAVQNDTATPRAVSAPEEYIPTYVVIPVKNRLDLTKSILTQLKEQGGYDEVIVFDNGSTDGTVEYLDTQEIASAFDAPGQDIYVLWNEGVKEAQRLAEGKPCNIAILNNDLNLGPRFLENLAEALRGTNALAVCGNYDGRTGTDVIQVKSTFKEGGFAGFAFMVRGECMGTVVPYFDEHYTWYFGDDDFVNEIEAASCWYGLATKAQFEHIGGGSQTSSNGTRERLGTKELRDSVKKDTDYYVAKWSARMAHA